MQYLIKELRMATGLSQKEFADRFEIPVSTLRKWEQGSASPAPYIVRLLAGAIPGCDVSLEKIPYQNNVFYFDRATGTVLDQAGNAVHVRDDLDGVHRNNLGLYLHDLFEGLYVLQNKFERDCEFDRKDGILWS